MQLWARIPLSFPSCAILRTLCTYIPFDAEKIYSVFCCFNNSMAGMVVIYQGQRDRTMNFSTPSYTYLLREEGDAYLMLPPALTST